MICVHARQSELEKMGASALSKLVITQMNRIEHLELQLAKMHRAQFGPKSEKAPVNSDQLMLGLNTSVIEAHTTASRLDLPEEQTLSPFLISSYPNIDQFTEHGQIVIGYIEPVGAVAIAAEGRETLAILRRRKDEPFRQLLMRLDMAIASATMDDVYIDEVNTPQS